MREWHAQLVEVAGLLGLAIALSYIHPALSIALVAVYAIVAANLER